MTSPPTRLMQFGAWCVATLRDDFGDIDGGQAQDKMLELGILERVSITNFCGIYCRCAEYSDTPDTCLQVKEDCAEIMRALRK